MYSSGLSCYKIIEPNEANNIPCLNHFFYLFTAHVFVVIDMISKDVVHQNDKMSYLL